MESKNFNFRSAMESKNFNFSKTRDALSQLSADIIELESLVAAKKSSLKSEKQNLLDELAAKEQKIAGLRTAAEDALTKIENINHYIEEAL